MAKNAKITIYDIRSIQAKAKQSKSHRLISHTTISVTDLRVAFRGLHDSSFLANIYNELSIPNHNSSHICKSARL